MKVIAISTKGQEFMYSGRTAHKVSEASANMICKALNDAKYRIKEDEVWFVHDVDRYDVAYDYAQYQSFKRYKGKIIETSY